MRSQAIEQNCNQLERGYGLVKHNSRIVTPIEQPYLKSYHGLLVRFIGAMQDTYQSNYDEIVVQVQPATSDLSGKKAQGYCNGGQNESEVKCNDNRPAEILIGMLKVTRGATT